MKYNVGDLFVDLLSKEDNKVISYIFKVDHQLYMDYYWMRYLNADYKDSYWISEELDHWIESNVKYYPVKE